MSQVPPSAVTPPGAVADLLAVGQFHLVVGGGDAAVGIGDLDVGYMTNWRRRRPASMISAAQAETCQRFSYFGPEPIKGHGPHRYVFQVYALGRGLLDRPDRDALVRSRPRALLASVDAPVLARGRITGVYER